jgi:hypothetical protein
MTVTFPKITTTTTTTTTTLVTFHLFIKQTPLNLAPYSGSLPLSALVI